MSQISLKTLLVPSKDIQVEYPGMPGFVVSISFLSRETLQSIRKKSTKTTFKKNQPVDELNDELFLELYVKSAIKGWNGFKISYLEQLAPINTDGLNPDDELEYTEENALFLMKNSAPFDSFISEKVSDLANFSKTK